MNCSAFQAGGVEVRLSAGLRPCGYENIAFQAKQ